MPSCVPKMKGKISSCKAEVAQHVPGFSIPGNPSDFDYHLKVLESLIFRQGFRHCSVQIQLRSFAFNFRQIRSMRKALC